MVICISRLTAWQQLCVDGPNVSTAPRSQELLTTSRGVATTQAPRRMSYQIFLSSEASMHSSAGREEEVSG